MRNNQKLSLFCVLIALGVLLLSCRSEDDDYLTHRWFYVARALKSDADVREIQEIVERAAENCLNGMVFAARLDQLSFQSEAYLQRLAQVREICRRNNIEIIPKIFSVGYGSAILYADRNLAAGLPVRDLRYVVRGRFAYLEQDPETGGIDGGFETYSPGRLSKGQTLDQPGQLSFADQSIKKSGRQSLRFQNFERSSSGNARIIQQLPIKPAKNYTLSIWLKTSDLSPANNLAFQVHGDGGRILRLYNARASETSDWQQISFDFNSFQSRNATLYAGIWGGKAGKFWFDDLSLTENGLANVLRRPGTPITVVHAGNGKAFQEGRDYSVVDDPEFDFARSHKGPPLAILAGGSIREGDVLLVSYYQGLEVRDGQVSVCMSEPKLYDLWRRQIELLFQHLQPQKFFLSMDEIRQGGACQACKSRGLTMAQILADCIAKQTEILKSHNKDAQVFIWSDMLDPHHNAKSGYYLVDGDFTGSWTEISKDVTVVCWHYAKREESLSHFSRLGFQTIGAAYYDTESLENVEGWLSALKGTRHAAGILYTTWQNKYELLAPFGAMVKKSMTTKPETK